MVLVPSIESVKQRWIVVDCSWSASLETPCSRLCSHLHFQLHPFPSFQSNNLFPARSSTFTIAPFSDLSSDSRLPSIVVLASSLLLRSPVEPRPTVVSRAAFRSQGIKGQQRRISSCLLIWKARTFQGNNSSPLCRPRYSLVPSKLLDLLERLSTPLTTPAVKDDLVIVPRSME